jgi:hypothetical protein
MDLNQMRKLAGMSEVKIELLSEAKDHTSAHEKAEKALFKTTHDNLMKVDDMCEQRLFDQLTPEHKKQYETLHKSVKDILKVMKAHLDTYK